MFDFLNNSKLWISDDTHASWFEVGSKLVRSWFELN